MTQGSPASRQLPDTVLDGQVIQRADCQSCRLLRHQILQQIHGLLRNVRLAAAHQHLHMAEGQFRPGLLNSTTHFPLKVIVKVRQQDAQCQRFALQLLLMLFPGGDVPRFLQGQQDALPHLGVHMGAVIQNPVHGAPDTPAASATIWIVGRLLMVHSILLCITHHQLPPMGIDCPVPAAAEKQVPSGKLLTFYKFTMFSGRCQICRRLSIKW